MELACSQIGLHSIPQAASADPVRFAAVWEPLERAYLERLAAVTPPSAEWRERVRANAAETVRLVEAHPAEARFLVVDALAVGEQGRARQRALADRLAALLDSARDELPDPHRVPAATAPWIVAMFFDRVYRHCSDPTRPDLSAQLPELMFLAVSAYFGTEAGLEELVQRS